MGKRDQKECLLCKKGEGTPGVCAASLPNSFMLCPLDGSSHKSDLGIMGKHTEVNVCQDGNCWSRSQEHPWESQWAFLKCSQY